ncbi:MAG: hypothetical protein IJ905_12100 [Fibrobacter sp.]|nr:hypothetical protein [Fibrobacter sp.]
MSFKNPNEEIRDVWCISEEEKQRILDFFQGAVYCWCKNRMGEHFSLQILMGGENFFWEGTPLIKLYEAKKGTADPVKEAAKCAGWLLKRVLADDKRVFDSEIEGLTKSYWCVDLKNTP